MNWTTTTIVFLIFLIAILYLRSEGFTSPGTMVQLASSHVPTEEDYYYNRFMYPQIVRKEITNMTGGDPGPLFPLRDAQTFYVF
jgi:hypothetical protein